MKELVVQTWDEFKNLISSKSLKIQYVFNGNRYTIVAPEQSILWSIELRIGTHDSEINDYLTNYAPFANQIIQKFDDFGNPIVAPSLDDSMGLYPKKKMYRNFIHAGQFNIIDIEVVSEQRITGGEYWIKQADVEKVHEDDYVEFSVVDKNDVLGLFQYYGLQPGDVLELSKFVIKDYIKKGCATECYHSQLYQGIKGTNLVVPGLFFRVMYESYGNQDLIFKWRLYYYE